MIFNKTPFEAVDLDDLKSLVKTKSGANLVFPQSPATSEECRQLLRSLIEPDPVKRIEWEAFFMHPVFNKHSDEPQKVDMKSSVMFRNHEDRVNKLFHKNQSKK